MGSKWGVEGRGEGGHSPPCCLQTVTFNQSLDKWTVKMAGITLKRNVPAEQPLISFPPIFHHCQLLEHQITNKKAQAWSQLRLTLDKLAGFGDGRRSNVSALIFSLYLS